MANRPSKRRRMRAKAAQAKRDGIVASNLSSPKPERTPKGLAVSSSDRERMFAKTHSSTFRSPHHEGGNVKVIAHLGFNSGRVDMAATSNFGKVPEPVVRRATAATAPRFAKLEAWQADARRTAKDRKIAQQAREAWKRGTKTPWAAE